MRKCYEDYGVRNFVIGSGGSAFSDGGFGAVQALQVFDFFDEQGNKITHQVPFGEVKQVREARLIDPDFLNQVSVLMPCDVKNPLLGPKGSAHVYGPQKGATPEQVIVLDQNIDHVIRMFLKGKYGNDEQFAKLSETPSSGASGGIVGAFLALFGKRTSIVSGM